MAFILRGKRKNERVEIAQHANDWVSTKDGGVFRVTALLYTKDELDIFYKEHEGQFWGFEIYPIKLADGFYKIRKRKLRKINVRDWVTVYLIKTSEFNRAILGDTLSITGLDTLSRDLQSGFDYFPGILRDYIPSNFLIYKLLKGLEYNLIPIEEIKEIQEQMTSRGREIISINNKPVRIALW